MASAVAVDVPLEVPMGSVVLFDGVCNMCNGFVNFVIDRDPNRKFKFLALQSQHGKELMTRYGLPNDLSTVTLIENGQAYTKSTAVLRVLSRLTSPWHLGYVFICVPSPIRDWCYGLVAASRYTVFGKSESCRLPTKEYRDHFLDWSSPMMCEEEEEEATDGRKSD